MLAFARFSQNQTLENIKTKQTTNFIQGTDYKQYKLMNKVLAWTIMTEQNYVFSKHNLNWMYQNFKKFSTLVLMILW